MHTIHILKDNCKDTWTSLFLSTQDVFSIKSNIVFHADNNGNINDNDVIDKQEQCKGIQTFVSLKKEGFQVLSFWCIACKALTMSFFLLFYSRWIILVLKKPQQGEWSKQHARKEKLWALHTVPVLFVCIIEQKYSNKLIHFKGGY